MSSSSTTTNNNNNNNNNNPLKIFPRFILSGLAGITASGIVQPFEFVKVKANMTGIGKKSVKLPVYPTLLKILRNEPLLLYSGFTAGILRQVTYGAGRLGMYFTIQKKYVNWRHGKILFIERLGLGILVGSTACVFENPTILVFNRMMQDGNFPVESRRNYKNGIDGICKVVKNEGLSALWKGFSISVYRAAALNGAQLSVYSQSKIYFGKKFKKYLKDEYDLKLVVPCSIIAGIALTTASFPFDLLRTRAQNLLADQGIVSSVPKEFMKVWKSEGPLALYRGYSMGLVRFAPHGILILTFFEFYKKIYMKLKSMK